MTREEAKDLFEKDKAKHGAYVNVSGNVDIIFDFFERELSKSSGLPSIALEIDDDKLMLKYELGDLKIKDMVMIINCNDIGANGEWRQWLEEAYKGKVTRITEIKQKGITLEDVPLLWRPSNLRKL